MQPTPGLEVTKSLRLVKQLGEGGMGSVWIADHLGLDSTVAVKFITTELVRSHPSLVERFKREAAAAAKIKSPHVVQVFDHGLTDDGTPFIAMELLEGESLEDRLDNKGPLNLQEAGLLVNQVCQVLGKAHERTIVHRDIKPANIFLIDSAYDIFAKVLDFGIAKSTDAMKQVSVTSTGAMIGSPLYMSPEQFTSAKGVDGRADLWSLAVVAYHSLTGQPSFRGETLGQVMMAVMTRQYEPPQVYRPDLPAPLAHWFDKAFAQDIDARFQSADEMASTFVAALERASGAGLVITSPESPQALQAPQLAGNVAPTVLGTPEQPGLITGAAASPSPAGTLEPAAATYDPAITDSSPKKGPWIALAIAGFVLVGGGIGTAVMLTGPQGDSAAAADGDTSAETETPEDPSGDTSADESAAGESTVAADEDPPGSAEPSADPSAAPTDSAVAATPPKAAKPSSGFVPSRPRPQPKPKPATTPKAPTDYGY